MQAKGSTWVVEVCKINFCMLIFSPIFLSSNSFFLTYYTQNFVCTQNFAHEKVDLYHRYITCTILPQQLLVGLAVRQNKMIRAHEH